MLVLSTLHSLLAQILALPDLHTAVLLTPEGQLVCVACDPARPKDEVRVVVGLSGEVWQETRDQGFGMVDSEVHALPFLRVFLSDMLTGCHALQAWSHTGVASGRASRRPTSAFFR